MTELQQDEAFDGVRKQLGHAHLTLALLPLLIKLEPRLAARFRSEIQAVRDLRDACDEVIEALDAEVHNG